MHRVDNAHSRRIEVLQVIEHRPQHAMLFLQLRLLLTALGVAVGECLLTGLDGVTQTMVEWDIPASATIWSRIPFWWLGRLAFDATSQQFSKIHQEFATLT